MYIYRIIDGGGGNGRFDEDDLYMYVMVEVKLSTGIICSM